MIDRTAPCLRLHSTPRQALWKTIALVAKWARPTFAIWHLKPIICYNLLQYMRSILQRDCNTFRARTEGRTLGVEVHVAERVEHSSTISSLVFCYFDQWHAIPFFCEPKKTTYHSARVHTYHFYIHRMCICIHTYLHPCKLYHNTTSLCTPFHFISWPFLSFSFPFPFLFLSFSFPFPFLFLSFSFPFPFLFLSFSFPFPFLFLSFSFPFVSFRFVALPCAALHCIALHCTALRVHTVCVCVCVHVHCTYMYIMDSMYEINLAM